MGPISSLSLRGCKKPCPSMEHGTWNPSTKRRRLIQFFRTHLRTVITRCLHRAWQTTRLSIYSSIMYSFPLPCDCSSTEFTRRWWQSTLSSIVTSHCKTSSYSSSTAEKLSKSTFYHRLFFYDQTAAFYNDIHQHFVTLTSRYRCIQIFVNSNDSFCNYSVLAALV